MLFTSPKPRNYSANLSGDSVADRISQITPEVLGTGSPNARVSQEVVEVHGEGSPNARLSQIAVEVLVPIATVPANARLSQIVVENQVLGYAYARLSQIVIECLVPNIEVTMPAVYPTLPGLAYSVFVVWQLFANGVIQCGTIHDGHA